jgi:AmmeMemoRadiSam system protein B
MAVVINHHVLASDIMARLSKTVFNKRPIIRRLIILSPDHYKRGRSAISIGRFPYTSPEGLIAIDDVFVKRLVERGLVTEVDSELWDNEHGIGAVLPFLTREYGNSFQIVPIAIRADVDRKQVEALGRELAAFWDDQTLLVVSSDMSHYLSKQVALTNDQKNQNKIAHFDRMPRLTRVTLLFAPHP